MLKTNKVVCFFRCDCKSQGAYHYEKLCNHGKEVVWKFDFVDFIFESKSLFRLSFRFVSKEYININMLLTLKSYFVFLK